MVRYIAAALIGCLYLAGAALVIRGQGEAYRSAFRQTRMASLAPTPPAEAPPKTALPAPAPTEPEPVRTTTVAANVPAATTPAGEPAIPQRPAAPTTAPAEPSPPPDTAAVPAKVKAPGDPPAEPDPFWSAPHLNTAWDLSHVTTDDEIRLGHELHELVLHFNPTVQGPYVRRIKEAAAPLLEQRSRKDLNYTFTVLDSDAVCALSHPGGYVYVCRGLFDMIGEDEDFALQFVLAHEIAHVESQHALKCLADPGFKESGIGTLRAYYFFVAAMGYQEAQEYEADAWALQAMKKLDHSRYEALSFLRKFKTYAEENGFEDGKKPPAPPRVEKGKGEREKTGTAAAQSSADLIDNHFRAHPAAWERLKKLEALWPVGKG